MEHYFSKNVKFLRNKHNLSQQQLAKKIEKDRTLIGHWETNNREPIVEDVLKLSNIFGVSVGDLLTKDLRVDNAELISLNRDVVKIPVLGVITAGIPIEAQENIIEYVEIPKDWTNGGKKFFGLKISGDSMSPKYIEGDIVIFEQRNDCDNGNECAVMVNGYDATFKKVVKQEDGIILQPLNTTYEINIYSKEQVESLPITILGVAKEIRRKIWYNL